MNNKIKFIPITLLSLISLNATEIKNIEFEGLSRISPKIALESLDFKVQEDIDYDKINISLKKFFQFGYFDDIKVEENDGILKYIFKEKPSISKLTINGYKTRDEDLQQVYSAIGLKKGNMYTPDRIERAKKALLKELEKEGYINSVVEIEKEDINDNSVSVTFNVNKGDEIVIKKVNYFGAKDLDEDDFESVTANKEEDFFWWFFGQNDGELKLDQLEYEHLRINDLYYQNGYLDSKIKPPFMKIDFASNQAELDFYIFEGEKYTTNEITIYLNSDIKDPNDLYDELKLVKGRDFNIKKLRDDVELIRTSVADLGYAFCEVKYDLVKDEINHKVDVVFNVIPGEKVYINDVRISGNSRTLDRVIRRNVYLSHGDLFSLTDYKDSINKLKRSGFFETVDIKQKRISEDKLDLIVTVKEAPTGNLILGGGYGSYDGFMLNAAINDKNIFGSGLGLGFSVDWSKKQNNYKVSLSNPAIRDSSYNGSIEVYNQNTEIDYSDYSLDKKVNGFSIGAGKEIIRNLYSGAKYKLESVMEDYTETVAGTAPSNQDYLLSSITPYINFDDTDDYNFPRNGIITGTSLEYAGIGGDSKYIKSLNYFKYFYGLERLIDQDWIIRYKAKANLLFDRGFVTKGDTFYLGGASSVRGYKSYAFGPEDSKVDEPYKRFFANSVELNFPLIPSANMRWGIFYDYGMIGKDTFTEVKKSGTGAVLEWISPVGPIQFIFSKAIAPEPGDKTSSFEFSLGSRF